MFSTIRLLGETEDRSCGYCSISASRKSSWYTHADKLTVDDYIILMDSGWRRCGTLVYKPSNHKTCCPAYTIRCDSVNFRISKSQKKILRTVNAFLNNDKEHKVQLKPIFSTDCRGDRPVDCPNYPNVKPRTSAYSEVPVAVKGSPYTGRSGSARRKRWRALQNLMVKRSKESNIPYEKIMEEYLLRRKRRLDKNKPKEIENYLKPVHLSGKPSHFIDIRLCRSSPRSPEFDATLDEEFRLYSAYQVAIHNDPPEKLKRNDFIRFLVSSPLVCEHDAVIEAAGAPQFGSYHQQYWLDGKKLIAVGVIDLVPGCLSSVYFFYDPQYTFLHLGTYSALREIAFIRHLHRSYGSIVPAYVNFTQYYMGYYIHSCAKMNYKARFSPSYLICPVTYAWVPVKKCQILLDHNKYTQFAEADVPQVPPTDYNNAVLILPFSPLLESLLPRSQIIVEGNVIIATVATASAVLTSDGLQLAKDWINLVRSTGTMRIDYSC